MQTSLNCLYWNIRLVHWENHKLSMSRTLPPAAPNFWGSIKTRCSMSSTSKPKSIPTLRCPWNEQFEVVLDEVMWQRAPGRGVNYGGDRSVSLIGVPTVPIWSSLSVAKWQSSLGMRSGWVGGRYGCVAWSYSQSSDPSELSWMSHSSSPCKSKVYSIRHWMWRTCSQISRANNTRNEIVKQRQSVADRFHKIQLVHVRL